MSSLNALRKMSSTEMARIKKDDLIQAIRANPDADPGAETDNVNTLIISELRAIRCNQESMGKKITTLVTTMEALRSAYDQLARDNTDLKDEVNTLNEKVEHQAKVIEKQQIFLEQLDSRERGRILLSLGSLKM